MFMDEEINIIISRASIDFFENFYTFAMIEYLAIELADESGKASDDLRWRVCFL